MLKKEAESHHWCYQKRPRIFETRYCMYVSMKAEATGYTDEFGVEKKNKWQMPNFFRKREGVSRRLV